MIRLLLVEDHRPVRQAVREGLEATGEVKVMAEAATAREAVSAAEAQPDVRSSPGPRAIGRRTFNASADRFWRHAAKSSVETRLGTRAARA